VKKEIIFVTGGCRSGKSGHALALCDEMEVETRIFVATSVPRDEEMQQRVEKHRSERGPHWTTIEEPVAIGGTVLENSSPSTVLLIDCLTLWTSNLVMESRDMDHIRAHTRRLTRCLGQAQGSVVLVSNEVGCGIVPENRLARFFRDAVGWVNQQVAAAADRVILTVAGIPVTIKQP